MEKVINSYHDLEVWKKAMELVTDVYKITRTFAKEEIFGLGYVNAQIQEPILQKIQEIGKMINALIKSLQHR